MIWSSFSAFLAMGGYAGYVWGSYGVTAACIVVELLFLAARQRRIERELIGR
jgi:heme exporter protein D